jgi:hypothetical protein
VEQDLQDGLAASWVLCVNMCQPAGLTLNISAVAELAPDLIGRWDKIFRMVRLLHGYYV